MSKQDSTWAVDTRDTRRNISARERYEQHKQIFFAVTKRWKRARQFQPVVAMNMDPDPLSRSNRVTPDDLHFCVDCERATELALRERLDLQAGWWCLVLGEPVERKIEREVITLCGRIYTARRLRPSTYFAVDRYAHRKRVAR